MTEATGSSRNPLGFLRTASVCIGLALALGVVSSAVAADSALASGTLVVTAVDESTSLPLSHIDLSIHKAGKDPFVGEEDRIGATTAPDGVATVDLPAGTYIVFAHDRATVHAGQWWDGHELPSGALAPLGAQEPYGVRYYGRSEDVEWDLWYRWAYVMKWPSTRNADNADMDNFDCFYDVAPIEEWCIKSWSWNGLVPTPSVGKQTNWEGKWYDSSGKATVLKVPPDVPRME